MRRKKKKKKRKSESKKFFVLSGNSNEGSEEIIKLQSIVLSKDSDEEHETELDRVGDKTSVLKSISQSLFPPVYPRPLMSWAHTPSQTLWGAPLPGRGSALSTCPQGLADTPRWVVALCLWGAHKIPLWSQVVKLALSPAVFWTGGRHSQNTG